MVNHQNKSVAMVGTEIEQTVSNSIELRKTELGDKNHNRINLAFYRYYNTCLSSLNGEYSVRISQFSILKN